MTQKELSYLEDAVGHIDNIISICNDFVSKLENQELVLFIQNEISKHNDIKEKLMNMLEVKANE